MPLEIKELVIKTTIDNSHESVQNNSGFLSLEEWHRIKEEIVQESVSRIREIIKDTRER
ncbi:MAG: hypothetical protein KKA07_14215 [Bacteroidetes bacterium]|nr:hypothetical protein [Bacteroidota bacterium]MBU1720217.1 hypothetical protein [Bacteroidota bacterium]